MQENCEYEDFGELNTLSFGVELVEICTGEPPCQIPNAVLVAVPDDVHEAAQERGKLHASEELGPFFLEEPLELRDAYLDAWSDETQRLRATG